MELLGARAAARKAEEATTSPLLKAVHENNVDEVKRLIAAGANVNEKVEGRLTPPLIAASARGFTVIVQLLLQAGAEINQKSNVSSPKALDSEPTTDSVRLALVYVIRMETRRYQLLSGRIEAKRLFCCYKKERAAICRTRYSATHPHL